MLASLTPYIGALHEQGAKNKNRPKSAILPQCSITKILPKMSCWCHMTNHHWRLLHWRPASINMRLWRGRRRWNCRPPMCRKRGIESWTPDRTLMPHTPIIFIVVWLQTGQFRNGHGRRRHVPEIFRGWQKVVNLIWIVELRRLISVSATPKLMMRTYVVMMLTVMISSAWN